MSKPTPTLDEALRSEAHDEWRALGTVKTLNEQGSWEMVEQQSKLDPSKGRIYAHHTPAEGQANESFTYQDYDGIGYLLHEGGKILPDSIPKAALDEARPLARELNARLKSEPAQTQGCNALPKDDAAAIAGASADLAEAQGGFAARIEAQRGQPSAGRQH